MVDTPRTQSTLITTFAGGSPNSIPSQAARDLIVSMPMPNIVHAPFRPNFPPYNCTFDGATDDTSGFVTMLSDAATRATAQGGADIILPEGTCRVRPGNLVVTATGIKMRGAGPSATTLATVGTATATPVLDIKGTATGAYIEDCIFDDFGIWGQGTQTGPLVRMIYVSGSRLDTLKVGGSTGSGLQIVEVWDSYIDNCRWLNCGTNTGTNVYTTSDEGGGTAIGSEVIAILSATAVSGFGSSTDSSNQIRFNDNQIETFSVGAIAVVSTSFNSIGSHDIQFHGMKIEGGNAGASFTGKYLVMSTSGACQNLLFADSYVAYDAVNSGANVGTQGLIYWTAGGGNTLRRIMCTVGGALQYGVKTFGSAGGVLEDLTTNGTAFTNGAYWLAGGTGLDWNGIRGSAATVPVYPTYYAPRFPSKETSEASLSALVGAATPGTTLTAQYKVVNQITSVSGGAFVRLPAGVASPQSISCIVNNTTASAVSVKPPAGGTVLGGAADAAATLAAHTERTYRSTSVSAWV